MKITFLGTAAAEGFPALFCKCEYCNEARRLRGKNVRTRSQSLINDDLLIDFSADTYHHFLENEIFGDKVKYLFVTHAHSDHFYPNDLSFRDGCYAHYPEVESLQVFSGKAVGEALKDNPHVSKNVFFNELEAFKPVKLKEYTVTPFPARHMLETDALFYLIQGEKTLLYAHDTGYFYDEVFEYLEKNRIRIDFATFDCTNVDLPISDAGTHMGIPNIMRVCQRLEQIGAIDEKTVKVINHFSHNANPIHHKLEERMAGTGFLVAYDGMTVEF